MKARYLIAALIGAWYVRHRQQQRLRGYGRVGGRNTRTPFVGPSRETPFYPTQGGVYKPEGLPHTAERGGENLSELKAL